MNPHHQHQQMLFVFCHVSSATQGHCFPSYLRVKFVSSERDNCVKYNLAFPKVETPHTECFKKMDKI